MKLLQLHNKYRFIGGEWAVLNQEYELLSREHRVDQLILDNGDELQSLISKIKLLFKTHRNNASKRMLKARFAANAYDMMHVHNFFPLFTPSVFEAARESGVPSVMTLHNFRLIHPNGLLFHDGKTDERSVKGSAWQCVMDGVYRNSIIKTAVVAHMIEYHRKRETWNRYPSAFIALTEFSKEKYIEGGLPGDRIYVKPNFIEDPLNSYRAIKLHQEKENVCLYAGRISMEKGVEDLIDCWIENTIDTELHLAGDGPDLDRLQKKTEGVGSIRWLGFLEKEQVLSRMAACKAFVFPTLWYEGFPMTLVEAMSVGCPVITSRIGNPERIVKDGVTGFHFEPGNKAELYEVVKRISENPGFGEQLSRNARREYENHYTPAQNLNRMMEIYDRAAMHEKELNPGN